MKRGRDIAKDCDKIIVSAVFIIAALYVLNYILVIKNPASAEYLHQVFSTAEILVLSGCMIWKAWRLEACRYTKIVTVMYAAFTLASLIYCLFPFGYSIFLNIILVIFLSGSAALSYAIIKHKKKCSSKSGK